MVKASRANPVQPATQPTLSTSRSSMKGKARPKSIMKPGTTALAKAVLPTLKGKHRALYDSQVLSSFQILVYDLISAIPPGSVTTYKAVSEAIKHVGGKGSPRAVGNALRHNPFAPIVPCHRVIKSDHSIGGYSGGTGVENVKVCKKKETLLQEGVRFQFRRGELYVQDSRQVIGGAALWDLVMTGDSV